MNFVTLRTFSDPIEASLAVATLQNHGVNALLKDEFLITMDPIITNAIGGIKLQVPEEERQEAVSILRQMEHQPLTDEDGNQIFCPKCDSVRISAMRKAPENPQGVLASVLSIILFVFPFFFKTVRYCRNCLHEFEIESK